MLFFNMSTELLRCCKKKCYLYCIDIQYIPLLSNTFGYFLHKKKKFYWCYIHTVVIFIGLLRCNYICLKCYCIFPVILAQKHS